MNNDVINPDFTRDIQESDIPQNVLEILLKDRTTGRNILWMTDGYEQFESVFGVKMGLHDEIVADVLSRPGNKVIRPRVDKNKDEQRKRVVEKAEVFTPSWVCNNMNNLVDAAWFERETSPFSIELEKSWKVTTEPVAFPKELKQTWLDYVKELRLEMCCGEAPFLVSRYDATTGVYIPVPERIGLLDRKLRIVNENVGCEPKEWLKHAKLALQATLGFDWQGDNVFIARENMLWTVLEYYKYYCTEVPISHEDLVELAVIVSWNIWQMDGLKFVVPMTCHDVELVPQKPKKVQLELFELPDISKKPKQLQLTVPCPGCQCKHPLDGILQHNGLYCNIMDWDENKPFPFVDILKRKMEEEARKKKEEK